MKKHAKKIVIALLTIAMLVPTVAMLVTNAAETSYVELAFENIFVFEKWANNSLSSTALFQGTPLSGDDASEGGTLTKDIQNGTFTLTKTNMTAGTELFTAFSMDSTDAAGNEDYYMMEVEPNTSYTFEYHITGDTWVFTPYVFMYTNEGLYDSLVPYGTPGYGVNSFSFTTGANIKYIQVRFTVGDNVNAGNTGASSVYATVKDIAIYKTELYDSYMSSLSSKNLFSFDGWAGNSYSSSPTSDGIGTIVTDTGSKTITFTTAAAASNILWSGNCIINPATVSTQYYSIDVEPNTSYTLTYSLSDSTLPGPVHCQPYIIEYDASGNQTALFKNETPGLVGNKKTFTTTASTDSLQVVFAIINDGTAVSRTCKVYDIGVYESSLLDVNFESITGHVRRQVYEANTGTYGTLPEPTTVPDGMVFAGWYTEPNGSGKRITADTAVSYQSYTVYPKYEILVGSLEVATLPAKTTYTLGEKFNPAGLVLKATAQDTEGNTTTVNINSGYYCTPEYLTATGEQTITANYGGKTATFTVTVNASENKSVTINDVVYDDIAVANNKYTLNYEPTTSFNRYEITYYSDSYVKGIITFDGPDGDTEEFFLEPSNNGHFASYIDAFLRGVSHYSVVSIEFTCLNKEFGKFELHSLTTINSPIPSSTVQYYENEKYKVGIDLAFGGVISYIECLEGSSDSGDAVIAAQYTDSNGKVYTKVDYEDKLPAGAIATVESVNLINTNDRGRYLQQSYYGTDQPPFVMGDYNGVPWNYNPVQGGNLQSTITNNGGEASKVIDYRITDTQIYVKTRPLDWGKNSVDYGQNKNDPAWNTPSYMEAWYTFTTDGKGLIQGTCRFVDYSGYPSNTTTQEFPALYTVEPLNHFVYNNVEESAAWNATQTQFKNDSYLNSVADTQTLGNGAINIEEPEFWGVLPSYAQYAPNKDEIDPNVVANEHWAAFTASEDKDSFGIGIYSPGVTDIHYGCFIAKYEENQYKRAGEHGAEVDGGYIKALDAGTVSSYQHVENFRHANTLDPATELHTSYIAPIETLTFESYTPITYTYYVSTGTADEIREDFRMAKENEENADKEITKIAVPETAYMTPVADGATYTTTGKYYVNNIIDDLNSIKTVAESNDNMYVGLYALDAKEFTVKVTNATNPSDDIELYNLSTNANAEGQTFTYPADGTYRADNTYGLRFKSTGLKHGEMATAKWEITVTLEDGSTETYTAYTVLYAPERTVGAIAESRRTSTYNNEISSWITGSTGVMKNDEGVHQLTPIGNYVKADHRNSGYFRVDPLANPDTLPTGGSSESSTDYILGYGTTDQDDGNENAYVMQSCTNGSDHGRARSYLGLITVDESRYSNTNQIPNLKVGYDVLRVQDNKKDSLQTYKTYYTLGTTESYNPQELKEAPSGWINYSSYTDYASGNTVPGRESFVPSYNVSEIDGKYLHAVSQGTCDYLSAINYATTATSVLFSVTDKSALRDSVLSGYAQAEENSSVATYPEFIEKLEDAATVLGDPTATQEEIDNAQTELDKIIDKMLNIYYSLKYDNLFSAYEFSQKPDSMTMSISGTTIGYEDGVITTVNDTITAGETYSNYGTSDGYYLIDLKPNTEYVFEYDVTTTVNSQAFLFFYNSNGANSEKATNISVQTDRSGTWTTKNESNSWIGNYQNGAGSKHYAIKFTTGATTTQVGFRFGNTSNNPTTSSFSNIRLIDSARYYEDVTYSITEAVYKEHASYGTLQTLTRTGYTFGGWVDAEGNTVTGADIATENKSIFSVWTEISYTIVYNKNGGSGTIANQTVKYTQSVTLASSGFTKSGSELLGWSTDSAATSVQYQLGETVSKLAEVNGSTVTLYAVWGESWVNVTFDNLFDYNAFNISTSKLTVNEKTDTGFKVTSTGSDANTGFSYAIDIEPGKSYVLTADITTFTPSANNAYDVYVQALNASQSGDSSFTAGSGVGVESNVYMVKHGTSAGKVSLSFTAGATTEYVKIRFDANDSGSVLAVNNIRISEDTGIEVSPVNKKVRSQTAYGTLPTPTREGYTFKGWYNGDTQVTETTVLTQTSTVYLKSKWQLANTALTADTAVIDFSTPITIDAVANDTIFTDAATTYGATSSIIGISTDNTNFAATAAGNYGTFKLENGKIIYTPETVVDGEEKTVYYKAQLSTGDTTVLTSSITVVPASNVLYEENIFTSTTTDSGVDWKAPEGTSASTVSQAASTSTDVYGYDSNTDGYNKIANYSNGSALAVNVDATNKRSEIISFTFNGTGFDLNGVCGPTTGVQVVTLRDNNYVNENGDVVGKMVKSYIVDTYYSDLDDESISRYGETLYQVPIIAENGLNYSNYTVQIVASWLPSMSGAVNASELSTQAVDGMTVNTAPANDAALREALADIGLEYVLDAEDVDVVWFDDDSVLNGGEGVNTVEEDVLSTQALTSLLNVVDSVRVYNPIYGGSSQYIASEQNAEYYNVIDNLVNVKDGNIITAGSANFAYVSGNDAEKISIDTYDQIGPKDELYLAGSSTSSNAVTFTVNGFDADAMKVMISLRAASGTPGAKIGGYSFDVRSNTEMYYDITEYIADDGTVTIQNMNDKTLLSVGSLKITSEVLATASLSTEFNLMSARAMMSAPAVNVEPNAPLVEPEEPAAPEEPAEPEEPSENDSTIKSRIEKIINRILEKYSWFFKLIKIVLGL